MIHACSCIHAYGQLERQRRRTGMLNHMLMLTMSLLQVLLDSILSAASIVPVANKRVCSQHRANRQQAFASVVSTLQRAHLLQVHSPATLFTDVF